MGEGPRRRGARAVGATTAWTAVGGTTAAEPITGVRPVWSPNGRQIAFADIVGSTTAGSWGSSWSTPTGPAAAGHPRQPASSRTDRVVAGRHTLAFDADTSDGATSVYTVPVAGGNASKVTPGWSPAWASGSKLVVTDESEGPFGRDVQLYSVESGRHGSAELLQCPENEFDEPCGDGNPVFSPRRDEDHFDNNLSGAASAVYTMNADGSGRRQLTPYSPPRRCRSGGPNASALVYERKDLGGDTTKDTIHMRQRATARGDKELVKNAHQPSWSPDGKTILFTRSDGPPSCSIAMNADGTDVHQLTGPATATTTTTPAGAGRVVPKVVGKTLATRRSSLDEGALQDRQGDEGPLGEGEDRRGRLRQPKPGRSLARARPSRCRSAAARNRPPVDARPSGEPLGCAPGPLIPVQRGRKGVGNDATSAHPRPRLRREPGERLGREAPARRRGDRPDALPHRTRDHRAERGARRRRPRRHPQARRPARAAPPPPDRRARGVELPLGTSTSPSTATTCRCAAATRRATRSRSSARRRSTSRSTG